MILLFRRPGRALFGWLLLGLLAATRLAANTAWPQESSDLLPDPAITWGRLPNGLGYVVRPSDEPKGRVFLILRVDGGALCERDDQQGYAHLVEHLAFNGTRRFPGNTLVSALQRAGYSYGAHISAFTNYVSTFYQLDVPANDARSLAFACSVLREFASGVEFDAKEIKKELGVIESERRDRNVAGSTFGREIESFLYAGTRAADRTVIGLTETLRRATPERLREFYTTWYRPSRMTLIAVGDLPKETLARLAGEHFGDLVEPAAPVPPEPDFGTPAIRPGLTPYYLATRQPGAMTTALYSVASIRGTKDTAAHRIEQLRQSAALGIVLDRLTALSRADPSNYAQPMGGRNEAYEAVQLSYLSINTPMNLWRRGVRTLEQELRRALTHGFAAGEVAEQRKRLQTGFLESIRSYQSRPSADLATGLLQSLEQGQVFCSPGQNWEFLRPAVEGLTPEICLEALRRAWPEDDRLLVVLGPDPIPKAAQAMRETYDDSRRMPLAGSDDVRVAQFAYEDFGPAGKIVERNYLKDIDVHTVDFANGIRLNVKRTNFEPGHVYTRARLGYGIYAEPVDKPAISIVAGTCLLTGGLGRHDQTDLDRILAGSALTLNFTADEDAYSFWGTSDRDSLRRLLQLNAAYLKDAAFRDGPFFTGVNNLQSYFAGVTSNPEQLAPLYLPRLVYRHDPRYGIPMPANLTAYSSTDVQTWFAPILRQDPVELAVIGDVDVEEVIKIVAETLGALPDRKPWQAPDPKRHPRLLLQSVQEELPIKPGLKKSTVMVAWPFALQRTLEDPRRLRLVMSLVQMRLIHQIREELGATYAPYAEFWSSEVWPKEGYLYAAATVEPDKARRVADLIRKITQDVATKGMTEDEFTQVQQPRLATLEQELHANGYWLYYILPYLKHEPEVALFPINRSQDYQSITCAELNAFARQYLRPGLSATVIVRSP